MRVRFPFSSRLGIGLLMVSAVFAKLAWAETHPPSSPLSPVTTPAESSGSEISKDAPKQVANLSALPGTDNQSPSNSHSSLPFDSETKGSDHKAGGAKLSGKSHNSRSSEAADGQNFLRTIRVRPSSNSIRIAIFFDAPVSHVLRQDRINNRVTVDLIGVRARSFPAELNSLRDNRLRGIRLVEQGPGSTTLEILLNGRGVEVQDFALSDPPSLILDLYRAGDNLVRLPSSIPAVSTAFAPPEVSLDPPLPAPKSALPSGFAAVPPTPIPVADTGVRAVGAEQGALSEHLRLDTPRSLEYDGFPVEEIHPANERSQEFFDLFLQKNWATALSDGIAYLEEDPAAPDLRSVLYLLSEARYQLAIVSGDELNFSAMNFYRQALRRGDHGRLGQFGKWRLGAMLLQNKSIEEAEYYLKPSRSGNGPILPSRTKLEWARVLFESGYADEALALTQELADDTPNAEVSLESLMLLAELLLDLGEYKSTIPILAKADAIEREWWKTSSQKASIRAGILEANGDLSGAYDTLFFATYYFTRTTQQHPATILQYADILGRLRDEALAQGNLELADERDQEAKLWYARILGGLTAEDVEGPVARRARARLAGLEDNKALTEGLAGYAVYFAGRGDWNQAMQHLWLAKEQNPLGSKHSREVSEAANQILIPFMELAASGNRWHEILGAWSGFGELLNPGPARNAAISHVAHAMVRLGLSQEALGLIAEIEKLPFGSGAANADELFVWKAEALSALGRSEEVLGRLEEIARSPSLTGLNLEALRTIERIYEENDRPLLAAQTLEQIARNGELKSEERGQAWILAGHFYLDQGMTKQAIEIGLRALIFEDEQASRGAHSKWEEVVAIDLRLFLGTAYFKVQDYTKSSLALEDLLQRVALNPDQHALAQYLLGENRKRLGELEGAREMHQTARRNGELPRLWRNASTEALATLDWDPEVEYSERIGVANSQ